MIGSNTFNADGIPFLFTNAEYSAQYAYVVLNEDADGNPVQIRNMIGGRTRDVLNKGVYPSLTVTNLVITYTEATNLFDVSYTIESVDMDMEPISVSTVVRALNQ